MLQHKAGVLWKEHSQLFLANVRMESRQYVVFYVCVKHERPGLLLYRLNEATLHRTKTIILRHVRVAIHRSIADSGVTERCPTSLVFDTLERIAPIRSN